MIRHAALATLVLLSACSGDSTDKSAAGSGGTGGAVAGSSGSSAGSGGGAVESAPWSQMGYDSNNWYFNPDEKTLSVANAATLTEKWRFEVLGFPPGTPVVADGKVFVMATGGTYAINLADGSEAWKREDIVGTASLAYEDGFIYAHANGETGILYKLDATDGSDVWGPTVTYDLSGCDGTSSPVVAKDKVIVGHSCGYIEVADAEMAPMARGGVGAFDKATGDRAWQYFTAAESGEDGAMVWSTVGVDIEAELVFATTGNNYTQGGANSDAFHAIDLGSGEMQWMKQVRAADVWSYHTVPGGMDTDFGANPILAEIGGKQVVAAGDKGSVFWALDRMTGEILWSRDDLSATHDPAHGGVLMNGAFDGKYFYVVSNQPGSGPHALLHALDPANEGADVWPPKSMPKYTWGAPSVANGVLVVPNDDDLLVLDAATGGELVTFNTGGTIAGGAAAIVNGMVIVQSGLSYPFDPSTKNNNLVIAYGLP